MIVRSPRVSIGLPVYNGEQYLAQAIESILAQDFSDFELIIADNASTDRTRDIALSYAGVDDRVKVYGSSVNRGATWNFNRCVSLAHGYYFKWAAYDDVLLSNWLSECVRVMDERPDVVICYTRTVQIDSEGAVIGELPSWCPQDLSARRRAREVVLWQGHCTAMFGLLRKAQLVCTKLEAPYSGSDRALLAQLALMGRFYELPHFMFHNREHGTRSGGVSPDRRKRITFLDPTRNARWLMPRWRLLLGYAQVFMSAPVPVVVRMAALSVLPRWIVRNRGYLALDIARLSKPISRDS